MEHGKTSVGLKLSEEDQGLPYLYWTHILHRTPFRHRFIAGSSKCTTKELSCLLAKILTTIKDELDQWSQQHEDSKEFHQLIIIAREIGC